MIVADRITEIHPATNLLIKLPVNISSRGSSKFYIKKNNHKQRKSEKQKSAYKKKKTTLVSSLTYVHVRKK